MRQFVIFLLVFVVSATSFWGGFEVRGSDVTLHDIDFVDLEKESRESSRLFFELHDTLHLDALHKARVSYTILGDDGVPLAYFSDRCPLFEYRDGILQVVYPRSQIWPAESVSAVGRSFSVQVVGVRNLGLFESSITRLREKFRKTGDLKILGQVLVSAAVLGAEYVSLAYSTKEDYAGFIVTGITQPSVDYLTSAIGNTSLKISQSESEEERANLMSDAFARINHARGNMFIGVNPHRQN